MATTQFDLDSCLLCMTARSSKLFAKKFNLALQPFGLTKSTWTAIYYIDKHEQINQKTLAELLGIKGPSLVKIIAQLQLAQLIKVTPSPVDKRERLLTLTPAGLTRLTDGLPLAEKFQQQVTHGITQADLDIAATVMTQMLENAEQL